MVGYSPPRHRQITSVNPLASIVLVAVAVLLALALANVHLFGPADVKPGSDPHHAQKRHGGEKFPPDAIRACIAAMAIPFEYRNGNKVAFLCQLARNRWGIQIVDAVSRREITAFYGTLSRMKNILMRDGYSPIVPLP